MEYTVRKAGGSPLARNDAEQAKLAGELSSITQRIREVEGLFDLCNDSDLIEAYIYELRALRARYSSVLKQARQQEADIRIYGLSAMKRCDIHAEVKQNDDGPNHLDGYPHPVGDSPVGGMQENQDAV